MALFNQVMQYHKFWNNQENLYGINSKLEAHLMLLKKVICIMFFVLLIVRNTSYVNSQSLYNNSNSTINDFEKKWLDYLHSLGNVEGVIKYQYKDNGRVSYDFANEFVAMYPLLIDNRCPLNSYSSANVTGKNYSFSLSQSESDKSWIVKEIIHNPATYELRKWNFPIYLDESFRNDPVGYDIFNTLGVGLFGIDSAVNLPYIFSSEWFSLKELNEVEQDGNKQLHVSFEFNMPDFPDNVKNLPDFAQNSSKWHKFTLVGKVVLVTDYFLVSEAEYQLKYLAFTKNASVTVSYDTETYRTPLPKNYYVKIVSQDSNSNSKNIFENIQKFDLKETDPKSSSRFTLSAYGLPEPDFDNSRRVNRIRYVLIGSGILLIALALFQMYKKQQKKLP